MVQATVEWLIMLWKKILDCYHFFVKPIPAHEEPQEPVSEPVKAPYRDPAPEPPEAHDESLKLICTLTNEDSRSLSEIEAIKKKTRRRALRHFAGEGKVIRHRVTEKSNDFVEFSFFRRSGKPVKIRWQRVGAAPKEV